MTNSNFALVGGFWGVITAVQTPGAPTLYITNASPGWATIWWTPPNPGFVLQENLSLSTTNPFVVPATLPTKFYRLIKP